MTTAWSMVKQCDFLFLVKNDVMQQNHRKFEIQSSVIFHPQWETPSFLLLHTMYAISFHSNVSCLLYYIKEDDHAKESLKKVQI
jgi:hypothetical protein